MIIRVIVWKFTPIMTSPAAICVTTYIRLTELMSAYSVIQCQTSGGTSYHCILTTYSSWDILSVWSEWTICIVCGLDILSRSTILGRLLLCAFYCSVITAILFCIHHPSLWITARLRLRLLLCVVVGCATKLWMLCQNYCCTTTRCSEKSGMFCFWS